MPGMLDWKIKISADIKDLQNKMHKVEGELGEFEGKDHKVKLDLDTKTLESALKKLDSMLDSLGKGTGDFKQFETLSKDLAKVTSELSGFTKAFGKIDNSGTKSLLDMVQNIDKSLNNLSSHITDEFLNKITSSVGTVKQKFADIGDGSEFEPLLQMINKIDSSINNLAKETSKIKLNMNLDFGTEMSEKMNQQVSKAVSRQAQAYKNLFETMKGSGKTTEEMIKFSLPENASNSEIVGAYKGVIERAEKQYGKSTYSLRLGSKYNDAKNEIKNANAALRRAEIKRTNSNGVSDLLGGNFGDVINELSKIATKLDEISSSASGLKSAFETGFNVSASVEEIAQLTNKVKKLEDELQKVKSVSSGTVSTDVTLGNESNISSGSNPAIEQQNKLQEELKETQDQAEKTAQSVKNAVSQTTKKDAFPDKDISASVESATNSIKEENNVLEQNTQKVKENTQAKEQNTNVNLNKYDKRLDSYNGKVDKYQATIDRFNDGGWTSDTYLKNVQAVRDAVKQYATLLDNIKTNQNGIASDEDIQNLDKYEKKIKDTIATVTNMSAAEKGYKFEAGQKELDKIHKLLNENSKMSSEAKAKIKAYYKEIESGNPSMSLDKIHGEILKIYNAEVEAGRAGRTLWDTLKNSRFHQIAAQMAGMFGVYDVINLGRQAISTIVDLDDALLDLKKTTSMSSTELNNFYYSANDVAKQMGVTTKSIIDQASAWSRLGYSSNEQATEMAKLSSKFASISPGMDTDQAQEGMVSIMKAWQINPEDVEKEILDPINQLGNKFAESNDDIVEGMKRSAAALAAVGTDYKDAYSLFTGVQEVLQNSEVAGRALRSISMRIRGYDENSEDGFEQTDDELKNITGDLIDLTKTANHAQGVSIFKEGSTTEFKSLVDYFGEIHDIWDEMSQKQQNDFLQKAFGKTQAQAGAALIQNYDAVKEALAEIDESAGSADKEMSTVEQTLSYKINALKETWVGCVQQILDRGDLGIAISGLNGVSKVITGLIDNVGLLKTAAMGVAAALSFKNVGRDKMYSLSF